METGCQNIQLCFAILKVAFPLEVIGPMFLFPMLYMTFQMVEAFLLILSFRCYQRLTTPGEGKCHSCLCIFVEQECEKSFHHKCFLKIFLQHHWKITMSTMVTSRWSSRDSVPVFGGDVREEPDFFLHSGWCQWHLNIQTCDMTTFFNLMFKKFFILNLICQNQGPWTKYGALHQFLWAHPVSGCFEININLQKSKLFLDL